MQGKQPRNALSFKALDESPPAEQGLSRLLHSDEFANAEIPELPERGMSGLYNNELMLKSDVKGKSNIKVEQNRTMSERLGCSLLALALHQGPGSAPGWEGAEPPPDPSFVFKRWMRCC